jgi:hypothetical protein
MEAGNRETSRKCVSNPSVPTSILTFIAREKPASEHMILPRSHTSAEAHTHGDVGTRV